MRTNTGLTNVLFVMLCAVMVHSASSAQSSNELVVSPEMLAPVNPPVTPPTKPACPTVPNNQALNSNTGQVNALAPGTNWTVQITNTNLTSPQINEIGNALSAWNPVSQSQGITVTIGGVNASDGSNLVGNVIVFQQSQATVINGVTYQAAVSWTQTSSNGTIAYPKIAINSSAQSLSPALFTALMVHEIAHMMGIGDCTTASCAQSASQNGTVSYQPQPYATAPAILSGNQSRYLSGCNAMFS